MKYIGNRAAFADIERSMDQFTLDALSAFPQELEKFYSAIPVEYKNWAPTSWEGIPSETFTPIEQICHIRDIERDGYHLRFRRTLSEVNPTLAPVDGYALSSERNYAGSNPGEVLAAFRAARSETLRLVASLTDEQLRRPAVFEGYGVVTVRRLIHYLCSHDQQHLAGLQWLLGKIDAAQLG